MTKLTPSRLEQLIAECTYTETDYADGVDNSERFVDGLALVELIMSDYIDQPDATPVVPSILDISTHAAIETWFTVPDVNGQFKLLARSRIRIGERTVDIITCEDRNGKWYTFNVWDNMDVFRMREIT